MEDHSLFFYRTDCILCERAIDDVAPFFAKIGKPLLYRKLSDDYLYFIKGLPAIVVRRPVFNTKQEIIIVGSHMIEQLNELHNRTLSVDYE